MSKQLEAITLHCKSKKHFKCLHSFFYTWLEITRVSNFSCGIFSGGKVQRERLLISLSTISLLWVETFCCRVSHPHRRQHKECALWNLK